MSELSDRMRREAFDAVDFNGETMKQWDKIRKAAEDLPGSDLPRLMFESLIENLAELLKDGADQIDVLQEKAWKYDELCK